MKRLKTFTDERDSLTVAETGKDLPFEVKRAYWIYGVPEGHERGKHANRITYQYLVAVRGCVTITLEDKDGRRTYVLDAPDKGLLIPPSCCISLKMLCCWSCLPSLTGLRCISTLTKSFCV